MSKGLGTGISFPSLGAYSLATDYLIDYANEYVNYRNALKTKKGTSQLRTKRSKMSQVQEHRSGSTSSFSRSHIPHPRNIFKLVKNNPKFKLLANQSSHNTSGLGLQGVFQFEWWSVADLTNMFAEVADNVNLASNTSAYMKLFAEHMKGKLLMNNNTNDLVYMTLYEVCPRKDIASASTTYSDPITAWQNGAAYNQSPNSSNVPSGNPHRVVGATPFESPLFTRNWKVLKVTSVPLSPGMTHIHYVNVAPNCLIAKEDINSLSNDGLGLSSIGKCDHFTMIVAHGAPITAGTGTSTITGATTNNYAIGTVQTLHYEYGFVLNNAPDIVEYNNLITTAPSNTVTTASNTIMSSLTGATSGTITV